MRCKLWKVIYYLTSIMKPKSGGTSIGTNKIPIKYDNLLASDYQLVLLFSSRSMKYFPSSPFVMTLFVAYILELALCFSQ